MATGIRLPRAFLICLGKKEAKTVSFAKTRCPLVMVSAALSGGVFVSADFFTLRQLAADGIFLCRIQSFIIPAQAGIYFRYREIP
ncbi:MAG: hypothetical protein Q7T36_13195 [Fluviicoccus sp.]|uniref:hypothetical protein n=1 Tax=Fluviicoccus sp. TaxID=2003552 RepID=UPI002725B910|nr:hypothetical protein [Fluviicoccus sp.]MDO8331414.1 hypothetical protein [Fluviicoccus sp.]